MWLRVCRYNLQKDEALAKVLKIRQPQTFEWYLHELLLGRMPNLSAYQNIEFPPKLPDGYDKPIGMEFARYKEWDKVQSAMDTMHELAQQEQTRTEPKNHMVPASHTPAATIIAPS